MSGVRFTVDLEWAEQAVSLPEAWTGVEQVWIVCRLLDVLKRYEVQATFYVLGQVADKHPGLVQRIQEDGHRLGSHGYWHVRDEGSWWELQARQAIQRAVPGKALGAMDYRSPYWDTTPRPGLGGGKGFRLLPKRLLKWEIERTGVFWIHPHDLRSLSDVGEWPVHEPWHRSLLLWNPWERVEWLLTHIHWC